MEAWRYIDYEFKPGEALQSLTFNGIGAGVSFRFCRARFDWPRRRGPAIR